MNKLDKTEYKGLKFLASLTNYDYTTKWRNNPEDFNRKSQYLLNYFFEKGYVKIYGKSQHHLLTLKGRAHLRLLENRRIVDISFWTSIASFFISIIAFCKSMSWI